MDEIHYTLSLVTYVVRKSYVTFIIKNPHLEWVITDHILLKIQILPQESIKDCKCHIKWYTIIHKHCDSARTSIHKQCLQECSDNSWSKYPMKNGNYDVCM